MCEISAPVGAIVRVWFPESESVLVPGPKFRPALVLEVNERPDGRREVLVAYGTSQNTHCYARGEFIVTGGEQHDLDSDTKFRLQRRVWLPLTSDYFCSCGRQPKPVPLPKSVLLAFYRAAKEARLF